MRALPACTIPDVIHYPEISRQNRRPPSPGPLDRLAPWRPEKRQIQAVSWPAEAVFPAEQSTEQSPARSAARPVAPGKEASQCSVRNSKSPSPTTRSILPLASCVLLDAKPLRFQISAVRVCIV